MSLSAKLKTFSSAQLGAIGFYAFTGLLLLVFLPLSGFPPHLAFLGVLSLITAYSLFMRRFWANWLVFVLFVTNSGFALYTLYAIGFSNLLVALAMAAFAVLTWAATVSLLIKRKF
jgi:hypothetical protein